MHGDEPDSTYLPQEEIAERMREIDALVVVGEKWAEQGKHPWALFAICLHSVFLAVLWARKVR